jgi:NTP pyrophosphatase (non-canonical NTP hydrolase)
MYVSLKDCGETGEFAEHVGKAMRDDGFGDVELTPERKLLLIKEIGDEMWYLAAKCNELGIRLSEAAYTNLDKLCSRTERGVLQGSGDDR